MKKLLIVLVAVFCGYQGIAQVSKSSTISPKGVYTIKGDYYFDHHNYVTAINHYSKSLNKNPKDIHAMLRMAEAYHKLGNDDLAGRWYGKALSVNPDIEEAYILKYISILNKNEKYDELRHWITIYNDRVSKKYLYNVAHNMYKDSTLLLLHDLQKINSPKSDLGPFLYNEIMIFSSNRAVSGDGNYNLYRSVLNPNGQYEEAMPFHETINSGTNEGPMAIAAKPGRLFFTRTSQSQGDNKPLMEIFFCDVPADRSDQVKINKLVFKNFNYDMGHPAVNSEGTLMFFTSNNPKHARGFELYRSEYIKKKWSTPKALGAHINTHGDEMYPTLYNDSILYFASNGHGGLGGFDIYNVNILAKHLKIEHLNAPVNSPSDDFGLIFNNNGHEGYFTSNRPGGSGGDDLFKFYILPVKTMVVGNMSKPEELSIYTSKGDEIKLSGNNKGNLVFDFIPGRRYTLLMDYDNYKTGTSKTNSGKTDLPKRNTYAFHIQKSDGVVYEDRNRSARVQDVHINPGDLVTFQLIPNLSLDYEADDSRIRFNKNEATIESNDTIVFSYVAEGDSKIPDVVDTAPVADLNALDKDDLSRDDKARADTVSSTPVLAKNAQPGNKAPDADSSAVVKTVQQDKLKNIALLPDTIKTNNGTKDLNYAIATDSLISSEGTATEKNISGKRADSTLITKRYQLSDPVDENNAVVKNKQAGDSSQIISPETVALQDKEPTDQDQADSKDKKIDPGTVSGNAAETVKQNMTEALALVPSTTKVNDGKEDPDRIVAMDSLIGSERIATQKENMLDNKSEKNLVSTVKQADDSIKMGYQPFDPLDKNNDGTKKKQERDSSQFPPHAIDNSTHDASENYDFRYRVQIAASRSELRDAQLKRIYRGSKEIRFFNEDGYYKYYIEETPSYPNARRILKESEVENAFIAAYKGDTKWKLNEAIAFQKNELKRQTQPGSEGKNVDPITVNRNVAETVLQDKPKEIALVPDTIKTNDSKKDSDHPIATVSLIGSEGIAAQKENIPDAKSEKDPVSTIKQADASITWGYQPSDSLDGSIAAKKDQARDSSQSPSPTNDYWSRNAKGSNDFQYRVQIAASGLEINDAQLKRIYSGHNEIHFFKENGYYKYYIEETPSYYVTRQILKESNVDNAFISAYKGDTKWQLQDAIALQYKVPAVRSELAKTDSIIRIVTVNFELDKFVLLPNEKLHLREYVIDQLKANKAYYAIVNGYTDIRGSKEYNFGLSQERAFFVEQLIINEGINSERVTTQYFGESQVIKYCPENENCDESVHQANRRVEILLLMNKK